jgi:hypothetical protein
MRPVFVYRYVWPSLGGFPSYSLRAHSAYSGDYGHSNSKTWETLQRGSKTY